MSDLTVLVSPSPLAFYPRPKSPFRSIASRRNRSPSPIMVTLESAPISIASESAARTAPPETDHGLLSPPINTWKASRGRPENRTRHRPTRSQSAPPAQTSFILPDVPPSTAESVDDLRPQPRRSRTSFGGMGYSYVSQGMTMKGGELVRPPPPLLRPTTFWRRAHRSGVAAATYSPSSHLIRRSTYIAAGLQFDTPIHDLSALAVETRTVGEDGIVRGRPRVVEIPQALEIFNI
ncbi:hypothetical protein FB45DRAFT_360390 [Roridomyces roridus]|uniref:Uncharacterized protein n=1 Tax=Roridomyces roridus TaxID=1738132 RepID=A0AAD7FT96_9AGAR|nr:hypothetical protein FB45DRAFT_360390 [Roridomyces roridus]